MATRALADRPMPALASGGIPQPGMRVITFDGHRGVVLWTTPLMRRDEAGKPKEAAYTDPDYWKTLVRLHDGSYVAYPKGTGRADPHNVASTTIKALVDGLVSDAGLLPDDDSTHLLLTPDRDTNTCTQNYRVRFVFRERS